MSEMVQRSCIGYALFPGLEAELRPAQVTPDASGLNPLQSAPAEEREVAAIVAFAARYYSGMPFEVRGASDPVP